MIQRGRDGIVPKIDRTTFRSIEIDVTVNKL